jgi:hypothetical protein
LAFSFLLRRRRGRRKALDLDRSGGRGRGQLVLFVVFGLFRERGGAREHKTLDSIGQRKKETLIKVALRVFECPGARFVGYCLKEVENHQRGGVLFRILKQLEIDDGVR